MQTILFVICSAVPAGVASAQKASPASLAASGEPKIGAGSVAVVNEPGCKPTDGHYAPDGTLSWEPTCAGEWFTEPAAPLPTMAVVGMPSRNKSPPFVPDMDRVGTTSAIIQAIARKEKGAETGLFVNFDVAHGGSHIGGDDQKVGISDFVRLHPGSDGSRPGETWAFNPDIQVAGHSGNVLAINTEADFSNFNDCNGPGCFSVMLWHNYLSSHPIVADTYISGYGDTYTGTASIFGTRLTNGSGAPFTKDTTTIEIDGRIVRVDAVKGDHELSLTEDLGTRPRVAYTWHNHLVHTGILMGGDNLVVDQDFLSSTSGYYGFYMIGHHNVLLAAAGDSAPYVVVARAGQQLCLNGLDSCLLDTGNDRLQYQAKGNAVVQMIGTANVPGASYVVIENGGKAASIGVGGAKPAAPLRLGAKGGAPVEIFKSPLKLAVYTIAALPPCGAEAIGEEVFVSDNVARAAPVWHGTVSDGGRTKVRSKAMCNGEAWQYE